MNTNQKSVKTFDKQSKKAANFDEFLKENGTSLSNNNDQNKNLDYTNKQNKNRHMEKIENTNTSLPRQNTNYGFRKPHRVKQLSHKDNTLDKNRRFFETYNPSSNKKIKIIPLGGLDQIGMNITVFEDDNDIIIVDCGLAFPTDDLLGIDLIIPDFTYLKENRNKIRGLVITHGHEDHIGAIPYLLKELNIPIYGTKLTLALIEGKLKENKIVGYNLNTVNFGDITFTYSSTES